jgi:hypothetical protein
VRLCHSSVNIPIFQVDAVTDKMFSGNPAAVCLLEQWLTDDRMQAIAAENNLSETAVLVVQGDDYALAVVHSAVRPYWSGRLRKTQLHGKCRVAAEIFIASCAIIGCSSPGAISST